MPKTNAKFLLPVFILLVLFISCGEKKKELPKNAMEAGTTFIRYILDGDFKNAEPLLFKDSENNEIFNRYKQYYENLDANKKQLMKKPYTVNTFKDINDSVSILKYNNDIMSKPMDVKIIRFNKEWLIDFKYSYSGNLPID